MHGCISSLSVLWYKTELQTVCLRLWIMGNNVVNNNQCLAQTDCFISYDFYILSGARGINFVFLLNAPFFYSPKWAATELHSMNHQEAQFMKQFQIIPEVVLLCRLLGSWILCELRSQTLLYQTLYARCNENDIHNFLKTVGFHQKYSDIKTPALGFDFETCSAHVLPTRQPFKLVQTSRSL